MRVITFAGPAACTRREHFAEAREALDEAIARSAGGVSDFLHALSMSIKGMLLFVTGDLESGMRLVEQARLIHERLHDYEGGGAALAASDAQASSSPIRWTQASSIGSKGSRHRFRKGDWTA